jgi:hypothetical protein
VATRPRLFTGALRACRLGVHEEGKIRRSLAGTEYR